MLIVVVWVVQGGREVGLKGKDIEWKREGRVCKREKNMKLSDG